MTSLWYSVAIAGFAAAGLAISFYIRRSKSSSRPMICPVGGHCADVVNSRYSKTFGMSNELLGMAYYTALLAGPVLVGLYPSVLGTWLPFAVHAAMAGAFLMSLYLTFIQLFVLRQICTWCLTTGVINGTILVLGLAGF